MRKFRSPNQNTRLLRGGNGGQWVHGVQGLHLGLFWHLCKPMALVPFFRSANGWELPEPSVSQGTEENGDGGVRGSREIRLGSSARRCPSAKIHLAGSSPPHQTAICLHFPTGSMGGSLTQINGSPLQPLHTHPHQQSSNSLTHDPGCRVHLVPGTAGG